MEQHTDWNIVARTACDTYIFSDGEWLPLTDLCLEPGSLMHLPDVRFTRQAFGPVHVIAWWGKEYDAPLYLVTNLQPAKEACYWYQRRYRFETLFSDKKSRGFHIHKSHLSDPARLAHLLIPTSLAYIWMIYLGLRAIQQGDSHLMNCTDRTDKSLFRLGLDYLTYLLKWEKPLPTQFYFPLCLDLVPLESVR